MNRFFRTKITGLLAALILALFLAAPAMAVDAIFCDSMTGTTAGATLGTTYNYGAYVAFAGDNNSQVVVTSFSATSDNAAATCNAYVYDKENSATVDSSSASGTSTIGIASGGASIDANDIIVLQSPSGGTVYVETVASTGAETIALNGTLDGAISSGWKIYEMEQIATIPVGSATASYESDIAVAAAAQDSPMLIWVGGVASCGINFASGHYR